MTRSRITRLKAAMAENNIDVLVTFKPEHTFYLSGFNPIIYSHPVVVVLPMDGDPVLLVHALRDDHGRDESWVRDIRLYGAWSTKVTMGARWQDALAAILEEKGVQSGTLGIEEDSTPVARYRAVGQLAPDATLTDSSGIFDQCRLIKDPDEIANARIAAKIADHGMEAAIVALAAGGSERDVTAASMAAMNSYWGDNFPGVEVADFGSLEGGVQNGLWTWCLVGDRMFRNCDNPTQRKPVRGEVASIFIWTVANGIHAENERMVAVGPMPEASRRGLDCILKIRENICPVMKPGTPIAELFHITRRGLEASGFGKNIPGRIGHTIGIGAHEHTSLDGASDENLQPGMLFSLEPNLRVPGVCATQISDTILITEGGHEFLTRSRGGYIEV